MRPLTERIARRNIRKVFDLATPADIADGVQWYAEAYENAREMSELQGIHIEAAAQIIAALSPNSKWERNLRDVWALTSCLSTGGNPDSVPCQTYGKNKAKAIRIWKASFEGDSFAGILSGPKVTAFADNIASGGRGEAVTVDFHAYGIAQGRRYTSDTTVIGVPKYRLIAAAYRKVAAEVGLTAPQLQAVTWLVWKRL